MEQLREAKRIYDQLSGERPGNLKSRVTGTELHQRRTQSAHIFEAMGEYSQCNAGGVHSCGSICDA